MYRAPGAIPSCRQCDHTHSRTPNQMACRCATGGIRGVGERIYRVQACTLWKFCTGALSMNARKNYRTPGIQWPLRGFRESVHSGPEGSLIVSVRAGLRLRCSAAFPGLRLCCQHPGESFAGTPGIWRQSCRPRGEIRLEPRSPATQALPRRAPLCQASGRGSPDNRGNHCDASTRCPLAHAHWLGRPALPCRQSG